MELVVFFLLSFPLQLWTVAGQRQTTSRGEKCINFNLSLFQTLFEHQFQFAGETFEERIKYQFGRNVSETGSLCLSVEDYWLKGEDWICN